jgi:DNA-binding response OmpR family regulator
VRGSRHVLLVEDDPTIRGWVADLLEDAGYSVLQAEDGAAGIQILRESNPNLVVLDLMLPRVSGWQFLERTREQLDRANVPVLILSAIKGKGDYPSTLGAAAWLTKPLDVDDFLRAVDDLAGSPRSVPRRPARGGGRVLVVDDDAIIRGLLVDHLSAHGYTVDTAATIYDATARIAADPPALILLDLMLPGRGGWEFLRARASDPALAAIPVIAMSAAPRERLAEAKDLGANAYVAKPLDLDALTMLISTLVQA